jgi:prolyl 4-hydroxylase
MAPKKANGKGSGGSATTTKKKGSSLLMAFSVFFLGFAVLAALTRSMWDPHNHIARRLGMEDYVSAPKKAAAPMTKINPTAKSDEVCPPGDKICEMNAKLPSFANADGTPRQAEKECADRHEQCKGFHQQGECDKNPGWMIVNCPASCNACHLRDPKVRCPRHVLNMTQEPAYQPGDMNAMFESIVEKFGSRYEINVLSRDPWIVTLDDFVSPDEARALITATGGKWERSTDTGSANEFGETGRILSEGRTSSNAWCQGDCPKNPLVQQVVKKIEEVTGVPGANYESFQVLKYDLGQKYNTHHDFGYDDNEKPCGPRILTFFLYLSDVEEGGETNFPDLGIAVTPKRGRGLLWPSVLDSNLLEMDVRTRHEAKAVIKGRKFAANSWIHLWDFETPNLFGCTGTFDSLEDSA